MLETLYSTAIRRAELAHLNIGDIDFGREVVLIREGKGRKDRYVPIGTRALEWICRYLADARPYNVVPPDNGDLFLTRFGRAFVPNGISELVSGAVRKSGVDKLGSTHLFRHTVATLMLEGGADIRHIQLMLGHESLATTQIYTRVSIKSLKRVHSATHPGARVDPPENHGLRILLDESVDPDDRPIGAAGVTNGRPTPTSLPGASCTISCSSMIQSQIHVPTIALWPGSEDAASVHLVATEASGRGSWGRYSQSDPLRPRPRRFDGVVLPAENAFSYARLNPMKFFDERGLQASVQPAEPTPDCNFSRYNMCCGETGFKKWCCRKVVDFACSGAKNPACCEQEFMGCKTCKDPEDPKFHAHYARCVAYRILCIAGRHKADCPSSE